MKSRGKGRRRGEALGPYFDYDQASTLVGLSASYLKLLCDRHQIGYVVQTYYRGHKRRKVRRIPFAALEAFMARRYMPPTHG